MQIEQKANNKLCRICLKYIDSEKQQFVYVKSRNKRENFYSHDIYQIFLPNIFQ